MAHYGPCELARSFRTVRTNTIRIAEEIPEDKYSFRATPDTRSIAETLTHIAVASRFQERFHLDAHHTSVLTFDFVGVITNLTAEEKKPRAKTEILELLRAEGEHFASVLESLSDDVLGEAVGMAPGTTPETKSRFEMLLSVKEHEMHHRGQLMLVQRMIGIVPHLTRDREARLTQAAPTPAAS
ncbi:MAG: DinB family protein [Acidobacteria bacterium]|nr:DinB family protein [Acidobacteriota bacterium]